MAKVKSFIANHKKLLVVAVVLIVIIALVANVLSRGPAAMGATIVQDTTLLQKTALSQIVTGSGTVQSTSEKSVTSSLTYEITEVLVGVGDTVTAGQQLVALDTSELETTIREAKQGLSTQNASDSLSLQQAQRKLQDAISQRDADAVKYDNQVIDAENALASAKAALQQEEDALRAAENSLNEARAAWEAEPEDTALQAAYDVAELTYSTARLGYEAAQPTLTSNITMAQTSLETAKTTRDSMNKQNNTTVQTYQDTVDSLNVSDNTRTTRNQIASYERQLENAVVTAPISGTVTAVNAEVGTTPMASVGALFTIEDTQSLEVPITVAEYDVSDVSVGMQVEITSDALDGEAWNGTVQSISPVATDSSGNFTVKVKITSPAGGLKSGMSAKASIIIEEKQNIYAVPFDAVVTTERGEQVVYEYLGGEVGEDRREIPVATGMEGDYYIEIYGSGLYDGIEIMNDPLGVNVAQATFGFGMGGGFN